MEKQSIIKSSSFSNEWTNPSGGTTYYYDVVLENGDRGSIGVTEKSSPKVKVKSNITYTISNNKIKVTMINDNASTQSNTRQPVKQYNRNSKQESFLGYSWSYAKDFVVAGKTMKDVEELNKVARYIYEEIGKMLNENKE